MERNKDTPKITSLSFRSCDTFSKMQRYVLKKNS